MSKCRFGGAEGTDERVLAKDMTLNAVLRRHGEARERASAADSVHRQSYGRFQLCVRMATSVVTVVTRGLCVLEAHDVKIELVPWMNSSSDSEGEVGIEVIEFG